MMPGGRHPSFLESFSYAGQGLRATWARERNIKVMCAVGVLAVVLGILLRVDALSWAILILCIGAVIAAELMNTAIEATVDLASPQIHPLAKLAKDCACAGVLVLCVSSVLIGAIIYIRALVALVCG